MRLELEERLIAHVRALPEAQAATVFLRYWEGLSPGAIARRTGDSPEAVKARLKRGLAGLRAAMDADTPGGRERWLQALGPIGGGIIMTKKAGLIGAGVTAACGVLAFMLLPRPAPESRADSGAGAEQRRAPLDTIAESTTPVGQIKEATAQGEREAAATTSEGQAILRGTFVPVSGRELSPDELNGSVTAAITNEEGHTTWKDLEVVRGAFAWVLDSDPERGLVDGDLGVVAPDLGAVEDAFLIWLRIDGVGGVLFPDTDGLRQRRVELSTDWRRVVTVPVHVPPATRLTVTDSATGAGLESAEIRVARTEDSNVAPPEPNGLRLQPVRVLGAGPSLLVPDKIPLGNPPSYVRAPGYAWRRLRIDFERGGDHFVGLRPGGDLVVRFRGVAPEGTTVCARSPELGLGGPRRPVESAHEMTWEHLEAGAWSIVASRGTREVGRCECIVAPGELAEAELEFVELPPAARAVGSGHIVVPPAWGAVGSEIRVVAAFTPSDGTPQEVTLWLADLECVDEALGIHRFELPPLEPGQYAAVFQPTGRPAAPGAPPHTPRSRLGYEELFTLPESGTATLELRLPPPCQVTLALTNARTGGPIKDASVKWSGWKGGWGYLGGGALYQSVTSDDGRHRIDVTPSMIRVGVSAEGFTGGTVELDARTKRSFDLALEPETVLEIKLVPNDGDARFELQSAIEVSGDVVVTSSTLRNTKVWLETGGTALLTFPPIDGFRKLAPMSIEVPDGRTTVVEVPLVRQ